MSRKLCDTSGGVQNFLLVQLFGFASGSRDYCPIILACHAQLVGGEELLQSNMLSFMHDVSLKY